MIFFSIRNFQFRGIFSLQLCFDSFNFEVLFFLKAFKFLMNYQQLNSQSTAVSLESVNLWSNILLYRTQATCYTKSKCIFSIGCQWASYDRCNFANLSRRLTDSENILFDHSLKIIQIKHGGDYDILGLFTFVLYDIRYVHKRPALLKKGCKTNVNKPKIIKIPTKCDPDSSNKKN